jgi:hypothetical protein
LAGATTRVEADDHLAEVLMPEHPPRVDVGALLVICRSEPQMFVVEIRTSTSVGRSSDTSGTSFTDGSCGPL